MSKSFEEMLHRATSIKTSRWEDFKYDVLYYMREWFYYPYKNVKYGLLNLKFYFKVIWYDRWYDFSFIETLMDKKLEQMENNWHKAHYVGSNFTLGRIKVLRKRLQNLDEEIEKVHEEFSLGHQDKKRWKKDCDKVYDSFWKVLGRNTTRFWD
jgi:hypothetical protein